MGAFQVKLRFKPQLVNNQWVIPGYLSDHWVCSYDNSCDLKFTHDMNKAMKFKTRKLARDWMVKNDQVDMSNFDEFDKYKATIAG